MAGLNAIDTRDQILRVGRLLIVAQGLIDPCCGLDTALSQFQKHVERIARDAGHTAPPTSTVFCTNTSNVVGKSGRCHKRIYLSA